MADEWLHLFTLPVKVKVLASQWLQIAVSQATLRPLKGSAEI